MSGHFNLFSDVAVIILNFNGRKLGDLLDACIDSALDQSYKNLEVIFADNGSVDDSLAYVMHKYGERVKIADLGRNYGFCLGNNLAVKYASKDAKYFLFLNSDAVLSDNYVEGLVSVMERDGSIGVAQGMEVLMDNSRNAIGGLVDSSGRSIIVNFRVRSLNPSKRKELVCILWALGSAMIIRKELFNKVKGFSSEFFMYYDELDLCCRVLGLGYKTIGFPYVSYMHKEQGTAKSSDRNWQSWYLFNRNRWLIVIRYFPLNFIPYCFIAFWAELLNNFRKSLKSKEEQRLILSLKILQYLLKNFQKEFIFRIRHKNVQRMISKYIVSQPFRSKLNRGNFCLS